jgi:hypothetical protein
MYDLGLEDVKTFSVIRSPVDQGRQVHVSQNRESVQQDDFVLLVMSIINIKLNAFFRVQHHTARSGMTACVEQPSARRRSPSVCRRSS